MAIRTAAQYLASIQDNRVVYCDGERVKDVTKHPSLSAAARGCSLDYVFAMIPEYRDLFNTKNEDGEEVHFAFVEPKSSADLFRRRELIQTQQRVCHGNLGTAKLMGPDAAHALSIITRKIDKYKKTDYGERFAAFRRYLQKTDPCICSAVTDVKGDRGKRPAKQEAHQDYYVHIVDERPDGIVVRGAKMHISEAPVANEILVIPGREMTLDDKNYAVAFAVQPNTPGVKIVSPAWEGVGQSRFDNPQFSYDAASLIVFEDVFIPNERVFMKGEWEFAGQLAYMFTNFHRLCADAYRYPMVMNLVGAAVLMAEYNGIEHKEHVIDKLIWLESYAETIEVLARAACHECVREPETDIVYPNPMYSNLAKLHFAEGYHQAVKYIQDIGGGLMADLPLEKDLTHPEAGPLIERYLSGKLGASAENRMRVIRMVNSHCNPFYLTAILHAEGSLATQKMSIFAMTDWEKYKSAARRTCGITDGSEHPFFEGLPPFDPAELPPFETEQIL